MKQRYLILFSLSGLIISIDQLVKQFALSSWQSERVLIPGLLTGGLKHNNGFAFGLLQHAPKQLQEIFFIAIPVFALVLIVLIFIKLQDGQMLTSVALTTIFSGAIGNLLDRIKHGHVVDFFQFQLAQKAVFPPFNIADISIVLGVFLMFVNTFKNNKKTLSEDRGIQI